MATKRSLEDSVFYSEDLLEELRHADRELTAGHYIRHEDMKAWLLSWGKKRELRVPSCACGDSHCNEPNQQMSQ
jgi:predicted transcriptional regulator